MACYQCSSFWPVCIRAPLGSDLTKDGNMLHCLHPMASDSETCTQMCNTYVLTGNQHGDMATPTIPRQILKLFLGPYLYKSQFEIGYELVWD